MKIMNLLLELISAPETTDTLKYTCCRGQIVDETIIGFVSFKS